MIAQETWYPESLEALDELDEELIEPEARAARAPAPPIVSPLADASRGLRASGRVRRGALLGLVVHTTGSGPASRERRSGGRRRAVDYALDYYLRGGGGFPHYVIGYDGAIFATCDERREAWHAGWKRAWFAPPWAPPAWWLRVWGPQGARTPLDLVPRGSPNTAHLGVELLGSLRGRSYTDAQYRALAALVADVERRHGLRIPHAPSRRLLGHEDVNPLRSIQGSGGRADAGGGWDPGAHRSDGRRYFHWDRLWRELQAARGAERELLV